jgi:deoxyribonuclease IV
MISMNLRKKFDEIGYILDTLNNKKFGVCFDTCHAFASGYDLRTPKKVEETMKNLDDTIKIKFKSFAFKRLKMENKREQR